MNECKIISAGFTTPHVDAYTFPSGPRGAGIRSVTQEDNTIVFKFDDGSIENFIFPDWWFGTRNQYNELSHEEKTSKQLYFIEEGT